MNVRHICSSLRVKLARTTASGIAASFAVPETNLVDGYILVGIHTRAMVAASTCYATECYVSVLAVY